MPGRALGPGRKGVHRATAGAGRREGFCSNGDVTMVELPISSANCVLWGDGSVLIVTLSAAEAINALTPAMLVVLWRGSRLLDDEDELYRALLTAPSETSCAGMDPKGGIDAGHAAGQQET